MKNQQGKRPFNRKNLSEQNQYVNVKEYNRQREIYAREMGNRQIFILKAAFIALCGATLYSMSSERGPMDHVVNFALFGVFTSAIFTAIIFRSGRAAPGSFWGRIDMRRQKRARNDNRFKTERIAILELWILYVVLSFAVLRFFVFSHTGLLGKGIGIFLFAGVTFAILLTIVLLSDPRSFWGRMRRFVPNDDSPR
jgi:hypothetical protein